MATPEEHKQHITAIAEHLKTNKLLQQQLQQFLKTGESANNHETLTINNKVYKFIFDSTIRETLSIIICPVLEKNEKLGGLGTFFGKSLAFITIKDQKLSIQRAPKRQHIFVKGIRNDKTCLDRAQYEANCLNLVTNSNPFPAHIIKPKAGSANDMAFLLSPYMGPKDLLTLILLSRSNQYQPKSSDDKRKLNEDECTSLALSTAKNLYYIHQQNLTHRDIKPANAPLFRNQNTSNPFSVAFTDFEFAAPIDNFGFAISSNPSPGTEGYAAPETLIISKEDPNQSYQGQDSDIYSFGWLLEDIYVGSQCDEEAETIPTPSGYADHLIKASTLENRHLRISLPMMILILEARDSKNWDKLTKYMAISRDIQEIKDLIYKCVSLILSGELQTTASISQPIKSSPYEPFPIINKIADALNNDESLSQYLIVKEEIKLIVSLAALICEIENHLQTIDDAFEQYNNLTQLLSSLISYSQRFISKFEAWKAGTDIIEDEKLVKHLKALQKNINEIYTITTPTSLDTTTNVSEECSVKKKDDTSDTGFEILIDIETDLVSEPAKTEKLLVLEESQKAPNNFFDVTKRASSSSSSSQGTALEETQAIRDRTCTIS